MGVARAAVARADAARISPARPRSGCHALLPATSRATDSPSSLFGEGWLVRRSFRRRRTLRGRPGALQLVIGKRTPV